ncbi:hypothetical protein ASPWEDRAFT_25259 [Aspergillus wentii DTO 134E9]|uniref:Uncharacterized protein n=1 Tax=Aspergillus wentii DTO 134E9 TaxID=1073089 RepID=A0A1L9RWX1_ASPWE|nr:uncharacterized protein ASPWEDRAFT_25259 [Aspergillus wentii DTO 134E9]KAI9928895.1 hypothetical protein MW887_001288 [Aspergillus wentii]OJJ39422.1 hypothetical protein ASPWEDRAFT_25259 [Aspergillus wentii DTO 134E9]
MRSFSTLLLAASATGFVAAESMDMNKNNGVEKRDFFDQMTDGKALAAANYGRAFAPESPSSESESVSHSPESESEDDNDEGRVVVQVVTETLTECDCTKTSAPASTKSKAHEKTSHGSALKHAAQTPAAPASSATSIAVASASSSRLFGPMASGATPSGSATPLPSGADPLSHGSNNYNSFVGGAGKNGPQAVIALGVSAVMALLVVL